MTSTRTFFSKPAIIVCGQGSRPSFPATKYNVSVFFFLIIIFKAAPAP